MGRINRCSPGGVDAAVGVGNGVDPRYHLAMLAYADHDELSPCTVVIGGAFADVPPRVPVIPRGVHAVRRVEGAGLPTDIEQWSGVGGSFVGALRREALEPHPAGLDLDARVDGVGLPSIHARVAPRVPNHKTSIAAAAIAPRIGAPRIGRFDAPPHAPNAAPSTPATTTARQVVGFRSMRSY
jgi:hypothetical protein